MNILSKVVPIEQLVLLERNARYMEEATFRRLVDNIKKDGGLTSAPFCVEIEKDKYKVVSGNHRVMAAKTAGIEDIAILYTDEEMEQSEMISRQLSHNAIEGKDDPMLLKELYDEINDVDWKEYSGWSEEQIAELERLVQSTINPVGLDFHYVTLLFVEHELERLQEIFESVQQQLTGKDENIYHCRVEDYERLLIALEEVQGAYGIRNRAVAMMAILDIYEDNKEDLNKVWKEDRKDTDWVNVSLLFGTDKVPVEVAKVIDNALQKMMAEKTITNKAKWKMMELLSADYLAG